MQQGESRAVCHADTRSGRTCPRGLPVHPAARGNPERVGMLPARSVQRKGDGVALLDGGASPTVPHHPGHGAASASGIHIPPACRMRLSANCGELREPGGRRGTPGRRVRRIPGLGSFKLRRVSTGTRPLEAACLSETSAEPATPRRLAQIVGIVHHADDSTGCTRGILNHLGVAQRLPAADFRHPRTPGRNPLRL
jgi:hypothetical protein